MPFPNLAKNLNDIKKAHKQWQEHLSNSKRTCLRTTRLGLFPCHKTDKKFYNTIKDIHDDGKKEYIAGINVIRFPDKKGIIQVWVKISIKYQQLATLEIVLDCSTFGTWLFSFIQLKFLVLHHEDKSIIDDGIIIQIPVSLEHAVLISLAVLTL